MPQWYNIAAEAPWLVEKQQYPAGSGITSFFQGLTSGFQQAQDEKQKRDDFNYEVDQAGFTGPGAQHAGRNYFREVVKGYLGAGMVPTNLEDQQKVLNQQLTLQHIKGVGLQNVQQAITNENMLQVRGGMAAYGQMFNDISQLPNGWADPQAQRLLGEFVKKYPYMPDKLIQSTEQWIDKANKRELDLQKFQTQAELRGILLEIANRRAELAQAKAEAGTREMQNVTARRQLLDEAEQAANRGDQATANKKLEDAKLITGAMEKSPELGTRAEIERRIDDMISSGEAREEDRADLRVQLEKQFGPKGQIIPAPSSKIQQRLNIQLERVAKAEARAKSKSPKNWMKDPDYLGEKAALDELQRQSKTVGTPEASTPTIQFKGVYNPTTGGFDPKK